MTKNDTFRPETPEQLRDLLAWAVAEEKTVEIVGSGSKRSLGRPVRADHVVELSRLAGISLYEPGELVLSAGPATPIGEIEATLAEQNQRLEFEPPDYRPVLSASSVGVAGHDASRSNAPTGTIGGVIACNLSGPRRIKAGAARDHFLGFHAVSGRGEIFKSGGRVVKNVTGYDLSKLMAGSWGTLAVMTAVTLKVLPVPEKTRTVLLFGADAVPGGAALTTALQSAHDVSAAAWLPAELAKLSGVDLVAGQGGSVAAVRIEGPGPSVEYRCQALLKDWAATGPTEELHSARSAAFWREIRDVMPFARAGDARVVWRLSVPPADGPKLADELAAADGAEAFLDWGGGLIWLALDAGEDGAGEDGAGEDAGAGAIRAAVARTGGHATLFRAPESLRERIDTFQPQPAATGALAQRIKDAFDPRGILNPGRMNSSI